MNAQQETEQVSPQRLWRDTIEERWKRIQENIVSQESTLRATDDFASREIIEQRLRGLKLAAMSVWSDGRAEGLTLVPLSPPSPADAGDTTLAEDAPNA